MHECKICGATVNFSLVASVCFVCARKIRCALNLYEDRKCRSLYREAGNIREGELHPITRLEYSELGVGVLPMDATDMVCSEKHPLKGRVDHCGQVRCKPCGTWVSPRPSEENYEEKG